jgi:hypothetical protein
LELKLLLNIVNERTFLSAGCQCLKPIIPATQEAEIGRIAVPKSAWTNSSKHPIHKKGAGEVAQGIGPMFKPQYCKKQTNFSSLVPNV